MRKVLVGFIVVLVVAAGVYLRSRLRKPPFEVAYAGDGEVTLWNSTAQVRAPVATVRYGDRLDILRRFEDQAQVRTSAGAVGWASSGELLTSAFWKEARNLETTTALLPIEARGHTRVLSNLHLEPSRDAPRIRQLRKNVPVDLYHREAVEVPQLTPAVAEEGETGEGRKEDWWLVRAHVPDAPPVAGWMLGQFVELDVPQPLPDYASSAGMRIVAWFELNKVQGSDGVARPQYLVAGMRGAEGQPCDFSTLRVYTWSKAHARYETAFVRSDVCGKLPMAITRSASGSGDLTFSFQDLTGGAPRTRAYVMLQTIVRPVRANAAPSGRVAGHN